MSAIFRREFKSYFTSPLGYIFLAVMFYFGGQFFSQVLYAGLSQVQYVFSSLFTIIMFIVPILTMRMLSEDKKQKTDQLLFTAPVKLGAVVLGKYFAALSVFLIGISTTVAYSLVMATFTKPDWNIFLGNLIGLVLVGGALISIGILVSSLTESQMVSAVVTFAVMMFIFMLDSIAQSMPVEFIKTILEKLSFMGRFDDFINGILDISNVIYFISFIVIFNFLTIRVLEKKRWS